MIRLTVFFIVSIGIMEEIQGGYPGFLCPVSKEYNQTFFPCNVDCIYQHGAENGQCGPNARGDFNCYCGRFTGRRIEESLHCIAREGKFKQLCEVDCQCSHGARTGVCDFDRKACKCIGRDPHNKHCKFDTVEEFADFIAGIVPADSPAWEYMKDIVQPRPLCVTQVPPTALPLPPTALTPPPTALPPPPPTALTPTPPPTNATTTGTTTALALEESLTTLISEKVEKDEDQDYEYDGDSDEKSLDLNLTKLN